MMATIYVRPATVVARNVTARLMGDPDPNREERAQRLRECMQPPNTKTWRKGMSG